MILTKLIKSWKDKWTYCNKCDLYIHNKTKCNCKQNLKSQDISLRDVNPLKTSHNWRTSTALQTYKGERMSIIEIILLGGVIVIIFIALPTIDND